MLDAITLERRGIPTAVIGLEYLLNTAGLAMRRLHGMADYPVAQYPGFARKSLDELRSEEELKEMALTLAPQVEKILIGM